jgi:hypothetical protein
MFALFLAVILQGVKRPGSVYSTMTQWYHLMVLQYMASSFHQRSVSTANINTVQYPKPYQQYEIPTVPAVLIYKALLPQSNIMAAFVHRHCNLFSDASLDLQKYKKHSVTKFTFAFSMVISNLLRILTKVSNCQHTRVNLDV